MQPGVGLHVDMTAHFSSYYYDRRLQLHYHLCCILIVCFYFILLDFAFFVQYALFCIADCVLKI